MLGDHTHGLVSVWIGSMKPVRELDGHGRTGVTMEQGRSFLNSSGNSRQGQKP